MNRRQLRAGPAENPCEPHTARANTVPPGVLRLLHAPASGHVEFPWFRRYGSRRPPCPQNPPNSRLASYARLLLFAELAVHSAALVASVAKHSMTFLVASVAKHSVAFLVASASMYSVASLLASAPKRCAHCRWGWRSCYSSRATVRRPRRQRRASVNLTRLNPVSRLEASATATVSVSRESGALAAVSRRALGRRV